MAKGLCVLLRSFFLMQRQYYFLAQLDCVPGFLNVVADRLSRGSPPAALGFDPGQVVPICWASLPRAPSLVHFPADSPLPGFV